MNSVSTNPAFYVSSITQRYRSWFSMMPIRLSDINSFEKQFNLSINVYEPLGIDQVRPMRLSSYLGNNHNDLILYKRHYSRIISLSRLMSKQINTNTRKTFICKRCLNNFYTERDLNQHNLYLYVTHMRTPLILCLMKVRRLSSKTTRGNLNIPSYFTQILSQSLNPFMVVNLTQMNPIQLLTPNIIRVGSVST